jgi:probable rRNA maturation factor
MPDNSPHSLVLFHFLEPSAYPRQRTALKAFIAALFRKEKIAFSSLTYIFCSDEYLLGINQQFLQHNYYTDIISFNLAAKGAEVEGEIYISIERVKENAKTLGQPYNIELHRVIFHGALHLCGYKDKSAKDVSIMRRMEDKSILKYFR